MKLITLYITILVTAMRIYAMEPSPELEKALLESLASPDALEVNKTLNRIGDESLISPKIIQNLTELLDDSRPGLRVSNDVVGRSPSKNAYKVLSKISGFSPSQPSLLFSESKQELKKFVYDKYPNIFESNKIKSSSNDYENNESHENHNSSRKIKNENSAIDKNFRNSSNGQYFHLIWAIPILLLIGVSYFLFKKSK